ncbi:unnamed protein product, partial [Symbiodinium sp. KB8]
MVAGDALWEYSPLLVTAAIVLVLAARLLCPDRQLSGKRRVAGSGRASADNEDWEVVSTRPTKREWQQRSMQRARAPDRTARRRPTRVAHDWAGEDGASDDADSDDDFASGPFAQSRALTIIPASAAVMGVSRFGASTAEQAVLDDARAFAAASRNTASWGRRAASPSPHQRRRHRAPSHEMDPYQDLFAHASSPSQPLRHSLASGTRGGAVSPELSASSLGASGPARARLDFGSPRFSLHPQQGDLAAHSPAPPRYDPSATAVGSVMV